VQLELKIRIVMQLAQQTMVWNTPCVQTKLGHGNKSAWRDLPVHETGRASDPEIMRSPNQNPGHVSTTMHDLSAGDPAC
jgi:hypothetical protein